MDINTEFYSVIGERACKRLLLCLCVCVHNKLKLLENFISVNGDRDADRRHLHTLGKIYEKKKTYQTKIKY